MVVFSLLAISILLWLIWQLIKAKRFTRFCHYIEHNLKQEVAEKLVAEFMNPSSQFSILKNEPARTVEFWMQYKVRILQAALLTDIINEDWLKQTNNVRNSQHLFFIDREKIVVLENKHPMDKSNLENHIGA